MFQYSISLAWSDEDAGYIATVPEFPNLSAFGKTPDEAVREVQTAAGLMLEIMAEDGEMPPPPKKLVEFSGQTRLRLPKALHRDLAREAEAEGVSLNTLIVSQMAEYLGRKTRVPMPITGKPQTPVVASPAYAQACFFTQSEGDPFRPWVTVSLSWPQPRTEVDWNTVPADHARIRPEAEENVREVCH